MSKIEMTKERAWEVIKKVTDQPKKTLFGLDDVIEKCAFHFFTFIPFTDPFTHKKSLRQPHALLISRPGYGKTDTVNMISSAINAIYGRIQGTNDILPYDILGSDVPVFENTGGVKNIILKPGPLFAHVVLIDEINRIMPKTKSAFLEACEEQAVTIVTSEENAETKNTFPLYPLSGDINDIMGRRYFICFATQNPIETEGTYDSSEAELDRFTSSILIERPSLEDENKIGDKKVIGRKAEKVTDLGEVLDVAHFIWNNVELSAGVKMYATKLIRGTEASQENNGKLNRFLSHHVLCGCSPRTNNHLTPLALTIAFFRDSEVVTPDHVREAARLVLPHRIVLTDIALAEGIPKEENTRKIVEKVLESVQVPPEA